MKKKLVESSVKHNISEQQSNFKEHIGLRFYIVLIIWLSWALTQSLSMLKIMPSSYTQILWYLKNPLGVLVVIVCTVLYLEDLKISQTAILSLLFCFYAISNVLVKECTLTNLYQQAMYFLWAWCFFVIAPSFLSSTVRLLIFLRSIFWGTIAILFVGIIGSIVFGIPLSESTWASAMSRMRYTFGFRHPGYIATIVFSLILMAWSLRLLSSEQKEKIIMSFVMIVGIIMLYLTASRTSLISLLFIIVVAALLNSGIRFSSFIALSYLGLIFLVSIFFIALLKYPNPWYLFNKISSNRIIIWANSIWCNVTNNPWSFIWGGEQATLRSVSSLSGENGSTITSVFGRYRLDSVYVDMFLMFGVIGLILFVFIFIWLLKSLIRKRKDLEMNNKKIYSFIIAVVIGILVTSISASWIPSMGNLINISILPIILAIHYNHLFVD
ncbi:MAG TPA: hypothetical protein DEG96_02405 [Candidatus Atribacteria bacterium]|nr:hypothetical protein [Candidatus Atribacteria bacterium]